MLRLVRLIQRTRVRACVRDGNDNANDDDDDEATTSHEKASNMKSFDEIRQSVSGSLTKAGSVVGITSSTDEEEQKQPDRLDELSEMCPKLSFQQVPSGIVQFTTTWLNYSHCFIAS